MHVLKIVCHIITSKAKRKTFWRCFQMLLLRYLILQCILRELIVRAELCVP